MVDSNDEPITIYKYAFSGCSSLASIPEGLFDNNPNVTNFDECFARCSTITSIPQGLFDNNPNVTNFGFCFDYCEALTSIPQRLFDNNTNVTNFMGCFYGCTKLTVNVQIGSTANSVGVSNFAHNTAAKGKVYCRVGSAAYNAFLETPSANVNVLTY